MVTPSTPTECLGLIEGALASPWSRRPGKSWKGTVSKEGFHFSKVIKYQNAFQPWIDGKVADDEGVTRILCSFGVHPLVAVFLRIWFGGVLLAFLVFEPISAFRLFADAEVEVTEILGSMIIPPVMLAAGFAMGKYGGYLSRNEPEEILRFLADRLGARDVQLLPYE